jgi:hypothetical protein
MGRVPSRAALNSDGRGWALFHQARSNSSTSSDDGT